MSGPPKDIDAYLKSLSPDRRSALQKLRKQILAVVPKAEECISYSMPAFRLNGHVVAGFLATSKGCSYCPFSGTTLDGMAAELAGFDRTKSALHFDPKQGLPLPLIRKLLQARQAEFATRPTNKPAKKKPVKKKLVTKKPTKAAVNKKTSARIAR